MNEFFEEACAADRMVWFHDLDIGYCHPNAMIEYGDDYLQEYERRKEDPLSDPLNQARCDLVLGPGLLAPGLVEVSGKFLDVGPGAGAFIEAMERRGAHVLGYDVNPVMARRLAKEGRWWDPWTDGPVDVMTMWDVLEHFPDPTRILKQCTHSCFLSIPIFKGVGHAVASRHYKPGEHIWYFTHDGLLRFFDTQGFVCKHWDKRETEIGRWGIHSYVFVRKES